MELRLESKGISLDDWGTEYLRTTVLFSVWHHECPVESVHVRLDAAADSQGEDFLRCGLRAETRSGDVFTAGATGSELTEAIEKACQLLEVALFAPSKPRHSETATQRLAA